jgi:tetratricopeptide (TPR) repeat protein
MAGTNPMKRFGLIGSFPLKRMALLCLILCGFGWLVAQTRLQNITVNGENMIVTRVVVTLSQKAEWSYQTETDKHVINLTIRNCIAQSPTIEGLNTGFLVRDVTADNSRQDVTVRIVMSGPFYLETLHTDEPYKIVFDLFTFKKHYSFQEQLAMAAFYEKSGKWFAAGKQYAQMQRDFPPNPDIYYYWAKLLLKQHNYAKAQSRLELVIPHSNYYEAAQAMLAKLKNKDYTEINKQIADKPEAIAPASKANKANTSTQFRSINGNLANATYQTDSLSTTDTVVVNAPQPVQPKAASMSIIKRIQNYVSQIKATQVKIPGWGLFISLLILVIFIFIILDIIYLHRHKKEQKAKQTPQLFKDDAVKAKMVRKLLENGWNEAEIARELLIDAKDVKRYAKQTESESKDV